MFFKSFKAIVFMPLILMLFIPIFFIPIIYGSDQNIKFVTNVPNYSEGTSYPISSSYAWPAPGFTQISSYYGPRKAPTAGASTFHAGIDIAAPTGTNLVSIDNGKVIFTAWNGAGGYSVIIESGNYTFSYFHVDPNFLVSVNQKVKKGQVVARVGPLNVYGIANNPYRDSKGNPTNGATTGPHLHFAVKKEGQAVDPLVLY